MMKDLWNMCRRRALGNLARPESQGLLPTIWLESARTAGGQGNRINGEAEQTKHKGIIGEAQRNLK